MFEGFYQSSAQQPFLLWLLILMGWGLCAVTGWLARVPQSWMRLYAAVFTLTAAADAGFTANSVFGVFGPLPSEWAATVPVLFVLVGDFRFYLWSELRMHSGLKAVSRAVVWMCIVPAVIFLGVQPLLNGHAEQMRMLFLSYEVLFLGVWTLYWTYNRRRFRPKGAWSMAMAAPVLFYALWIGADLLILQGGVIREIGFAVRVLANGLYYAAWIPWILGGEVSLSELKQV